MHCETCDPSPLPWVILGGVLGGSWGLFPSSISEVLSLISGDKKTKKHNIHVTFPSGKSMGNLPENQEGPWTLWTWRLEVPVLLEPPRHPPENNSTTDLSASQGRAIANLVSNGSTTTRMSFGEPSFEPLDQRFKVRLWTPWRVLETLSGDLPGQNCSHNEMFFAFFLLCWLLHR